jgi:hypothetical protein
MPTSTECRRRAKQHHADAESDPQHKVRHRNAAEAWLLLARRMEEMKHRYADGSGNATSADMALSQHF